MKNIIEHFQFQKSNFIKSLFQLFLFICLSFFFVFAICSGVLRSSEYVVDNWFMFDNAEYILHNGFPNEDFITMHEGMHYMAPQWLFAVLMYVFKNMGGYAVSIFMISVFMCLFAVQIQNMRLIGNQDGKSTLLVCFLSGLFMLYHLVCRPFVVTVLFGCTMIFLIEKWIQTKQWKWLAGIPVLSVLQINFHNSLWVSLYLILLCYLAEWTVHKVFKKEQRFSVTPLLLCIPAIFIGGLLNPYGLEAIVYIFRSLNALGPLKSYIGELLPPVFSTTNCFYMILCLEILWFGFLMFRKKVRIPVAYLLLWAGFAVMSLWASRNTVFFYTCGQMALFYTARWIPSVFAPSMRKTLYGIMLLGLVMGILVSPAPNSTVLEPWQSDIDAFVSKYHPEGDTCFNVQNDGSYLGYKGLKPYIDCRAELFGKSVNRKADIASEYDSVVRKMSDRELNDFLESYQFDWLILRKNYEPNQRILDADPYYKEVFSGQQLVFLQRIQPS